MAARAYHGGRWTATNSRAIRTSITRDFCAAKLQVSGRVYAPIAFSIPCGGSAKGAHGDGAFQRVTWDEAFNEIVARLKQISSEFGAELCCRIFMAANRGTERRFDGSALLSWLGASQLHASICSQAGEDASYPCTPQEWHEPEQFANPVTSSPGRELHGNNAHLWPFIERRGARREAGRHRSVARGQRALRTGHPDNPAELRWR